MIFFSSCEEGSEAFRDSLGIYRPKCRIISFQSFDKQPGQFATIVLTVENDEDGATAYNVGGKVQLKRDNVIIDRDIMSLGTLKRGRLSGKSFGLVR